MSGDQEPTTDAFLQLCSWLARQALPCTTLMILCAEKSGCGGVFLSGDDDEQKAKSELSVFRD